MPTIHPEPKVHGFLSWIIRWDKYVEGQQYSGRAEFVVRGNSTQTSLSEALALELVGPQD